MWKTSKLLHLFISLMVFAIAAPVSAQIRSKETQVYADLISELSKENVENLIPVVLTKTRALSQSLLTTKADEISKLMPTATKSAIANFLSVGEKSLNFDASKLILSSGQQVIAISEKDYFKIFNGATKLKESWKNFHRQFPQSHSLFTVSRVGIDTDEKQALVILSTSSGGKFGACDLFLLLKKNGRWEISQQVNIWIT